MPIIILIALGYFLKRIGLLTKNFLDIGNKLTFRVFLPVMLFCNVYSIERIADINIVFVLYGVIGIFAVFLLGTAVCCAFTKDSAKRGTLIQAVFRLCRPPERHPEETFACQSLMYEGFDIGDFSEGSCL